MTDVKAGIDPRDDVLGPIDYLVLEFPPGVTTFTGELAIELASLVDAEIIRVLDLLILTKDADGIVDATEFEDLEDLGELGVLEGQLAEVLAEEDVIKFADVMLPGTAAGVLVWENLWAAPFAVKARKMGAQMIASDRIHTQALIASMQGDAAATQADKPTSEGD